jgi:hypothetical protein
MLIHDSNISHEMSAIRNDHSVDYTRNNTTILKVILFCNQDLKFMDKPEKINKKKLAAQKKKNEDLTPLDFINLIR